jgi:hypothetical protein
VHKFFFDFGKILSKRCFFGFRNRLGTKSKQKNNFENLSQISENLSHNCCTRINEKSFQNLRIVIPTVVICLLAVWYLLLAPATSVAAQLHSRHSSTATNTSTPDAASYLDQVLVLLFVCLFHQLASA